MHGYESQIKALLRPITKLLKNLTESTKKRKLIRDSNNILHVQCKTPKAKGQLKIKFITPNKQASNGNLDTFSETS